VKIGIRVRCLHLLPDLAIVKVQDDVVRIAFNPDDARRDVSRFGFPLCA